MTRRPRVHWSVYLGVALTCVSLGFQIGRSVYAWAHDISTRLQRLEDRDTYEHGSYVLPSQEK